MLTDENLVPVARWLTVLTGALCVLCPLASGPIIAGPWPSFAYCLGLLILMSLGITSLIRATEVRWSARPLLWFIAVGTSLGVLMTSGVAVAQGNNEWLVAGLAAVAIVAGPLAVLSRLPLSRGRIGLLSIAYGALVYAFVTSYAGVIDVELFVRGALDAMSSGASPYDITIDNIYSKIQSEQFYGPGVVEDGKVIFGFPYLPSTLLLDYPAHLVVDVVWMHAASLVLALALAWRIASDALGRACVLMLALGPSTPILLANYWVESVMIGLLALTWWGMHRGRSWAVVLGLGAFFSAKQYAAFFLPAVWPVIRRVGVPTVVSAVGLGAAIVGAFVITAPVAFYRSVVELQLVQPFREDAVSLLPAVQLMAGDIPAWLTAVLPLAGLLVSGLVAWRTVPGPTAFVLCVGLGLLVSVLIAKQAFTNYYMMIGSALLLAGVGWPDDDPTQTREPSSQGSRGPFGISLTRYAKPPTNQTTSVQPKSGCT